MRVGFFIFLKKDIKDFTQKKRVIFFIKVLKTAIFFFHLCSLLFYLYILPFLWIGKVKGEPPPLSSPSFGGEPPPLSSPSFGGGGLRRGRERLFFLQKRMEENNENN